MQNEHQTELIEKMRATIAEHSMAVAGERLLVAVSGGPDSTALLAGLRELAPEMGVALGVFHLDHGLRPEAAAEALFVRRLAERWQLPFFLSEVDMAAKSHDIGLGLQAAARQTRYASLQTVAQANGYDKLVLGHTADDVAETLIMRLLRGSSTTGLGSIPPVREGRIIRPLIAIERSEVLSFLADRGLEFTEDPSNTDHKYLRNRIRHELLPQLLTYNPRLVQQLVRTAGFLREDEAFIMQSVNRLFDEAARSCGDEISLDLQLLRYAEPVIGRRVVRRAVLAVSRRPEAVGSTHIKSVWEEMVKGNRRAHALPGETRILIEGSNLVVHLQYQGIRETLVDPGRAVIASGRQYLVELASLRESGRLDEAGRFYPSESTGEARIESAYVSADNIVWPVAVRSVRPGDTFQPLGLGGRKKVHDFLSDKKVPRRLRSTVPVYTDGQYILAVGSRIDERVRITEKTERVAVFAVSRRPVEATVRGERWMGT